MVYAKKPRITEAEFRERDNVDDYQRTFINKSDFTVPFFLKSVEKRCFPIPGEKTGTLKLPKAVVKHIKR